MNPFIALIAVGLDAARIAFSKSKIEKKAVSAAAAAVVGIGLFLAPMESVQAQESPYYHCPEVLDVVVTTEEASDYELRGKFTVSFDLDLTGSGWTNILGNFSPRGGGYFVYEIYPNPLGGADDWIQLWLYVTRGPNASVSAWVEDGDGNSYSVDVTFVYGR